MPVGTKFNVPHPIAAFKASEPAAAWRPTGRVCLGRSASIRARNRRQNRAAVPRVRVPPRATWLSRAAEWPRAPVTLRSAPARRRTASQARRDGAQQLRAKLNLVPDGENLGGSILDLTHVDSLTTSGLKALIALSREHAPGTLVLAGPSPAVEQVIRLAGYGDYFATYPDVAAALKAVRARETLDLPGQTLGGRYQIVERIGDSLGPKAAPRARKAVARRAPAPTARKRAAKRKA